MSGRLLAGVALLLGLVGTSARADVVVLHNGGRIEGVASEEQGGVRVRFGGGSMLLPAHEVARVERGPVVARPRRLPHVSSRPAAVTITVRPPAPVARPAVSDAALEGEVRALEAAFRRNDPEAAARLLETGPVRAWWDLPQDRATVSAVHAGELGLELTVERAPGAEGPIAVAFPPGTVGEPVVRGEQDLVPLRPPVVVVEAGQVTASIRVPGACALHDAGSPGARREYRLRRFPRGSDMERLMAVLCAGPSVPPSAQAAVWLVRNRVNEGGEGAAPLLVAAGLDPADYLRPPSAGEGCVVVGGARAERVRPPRAGEALEPAPYVPPAPTGPVPVRPQQPVEVELLPVPPIDWGTPTISS